MNATEAMKRTMIKRAQRIEREGMLTKADWASINAQLGKAVRTMRGSLLDAYRAHLIITAVGATYGDEGV